MTTKRLLVYSAHGPHTAGKLEELVTRVRGECESNGQRNVEREGTRFSWNFLPQSNGLSGRSCSTPNRLDSERLTPKNPRRTGLAFFTYRIFMWVRGRKCSVTIARVAW